MVLINIILLKNKKRLRIILRFQKLNILSYETKGTNSGARTYYSMQIINEPLEFPLCYFFCL